MNPAYFGDSYDLVKRFFCAELAALGYTVLIDPMLTGEWSGAEQQFFKLVGATPVSSVLPQGRTALLIDPDTGVHSKPGGRHVAVAKLASLAKVHSIVAAFDQSFSRQAKEAQLAGGTAKLVSGEAIARLRAKLGCSTAFILKRKQTLTPSSIATAATSAGPQPNASLASTSAS